MNSKRKARISQVRDALANPNPRAEPDRTNHDFYAIAAPPGGISL